MCSFVYLLGFFYVSDFSDFSMFDIKDSEKLTSHSTFDVHDSARLSGHPSMYWTKEKLLDSGDRRSHTSTAQLTLSVQDFCIFCIQYLGKL